MNENSKVLREIETVAKRHFFPIIGPAKARLLTRLIRRKKPGRIVEAGTLVGYSAIVMARSWTSSITTIEINPRMSKIARKNIARAGFTKRVRIVTGDAKKILPKLKGPFDFAFLDATKEEYLAYLKAIEKKMPEGSIVVADNAGIFADEMQEYLDYVRKSGKYESKYYGKFANYRSGEEDGMEISVKL